MTLDILGLREENDRLKEGNNSADYLENFVKFPEGNGVVVLRLLGPAPSGMYGREKNPFFQDTRIHRVNNKSLHCLKRLEGNKFTGECPICRQYNWLWQESEKKGPEEAAQLQAQARAIKPIERYYYNCIVRKEVDEKTGEIRENVGPKILSVGKTLHKMIIRAIVGSEELDEKPLGDVTDIKSGRDFKIIKTMRVSGKDSYPNYDTSRFLDASPLGTTEQIDKWQSTLHDLFGLRTIRDPEELKVELKKHLGVIPDDSAATQSGFDPSEYQASHTASVSVTETPVSESKMETAGAVATSDEALFDILRNA